ncbi:hypothetical protein [Rhizobium phage RHEph12]|nr:hypothetical protein [Rhizobium phage RHEph12]
MKNWISTIPHHAARSITATGREVQHPSEVDGIELTGANQRLRISGKLWRQVHVSSYNVPEGFMFRLDPDAEAAAPMLGKFVTSTVNTFEKVKDKFAHEPGGLVKIGIRQAVYVGVDYLFTNGDNRPAIGYYKIVGRLGTYYQQIVPDQEMRLIQSGLTNHDEEFRLGVCEKHGVEP